MKDLIQRALILNMEIDASAYHINRSYQSILSDAKMLKAQIEKLESLINTQNEMLNKVLEEQPSHEGHDYQPTHDH